MNTQLSDFFAKHGRSLAWQSAITLLWVAGTVLEHIGYRVPALIVTAIGLGIFISLALRDHSFDIDTLKKELLETRLWVDSHKGALANLEVGVSNLAHKVEVEHPMLREDIDELGKWIRPKVGQLNDLIGAAAKQLETLTQATPPEALPAEDTVQDQKDVQPVAQATEQPPATPSHFQLPKEVVVPPLPPPTPPQSPVAAKAGAAPPPAVK